VTVAAGDTVRWIVGDTSSGSGADAARERAGQADPLGPQDQSRHHHQPPHLPAGADFDRKDVDGVGVLGVPEGPDAGLAAPGAGGQRRRAGRYRLSLEKIRFRYAISGSNPPWKPLRAFDDGEKVYIQFPPASRRASCRRCS
jgi:hypothetical protein